MKIDISEIAADFPEFAVGVVIATQLRIGEQRSQVLAEEITRREADCRTRWAGTELSQIPGIAAWRRAYRQFGIKKTSYRSSVERLVKNVLAGRALPAINGFVDAYNAVSLAHVMPAGADDLDEVSGDIAFRYARAGDSFLDMASGDGPAEDPPKEGEVVYADAEKVLCRRWNWRQDARSLVTPETRRAVVTVQANGVGNLAAALADLEALLATHCDARLAVARVSAAAPVAEFAV
ncbi:MAG TPA: phenylalanine--tRNA ligase beta subunit-related protein [Hyphomicrobiales bacterium]|nr:phenylalanine--tRNA ligase beta subunit-related protein [Hyphomicrobiales bacterium]